MLALPVLAGLSLAGIAPVVEGPSWLLAVWAAGVIACVGPLFVSLLRLTWASSKSVPGPDGARLSDAIQMPLTWGVVRPVVLLPTTASGWPRAEVEMALAHEQAHIARRDWAVQFATELICSMLWFHPFAWWVRRDLLLDAELAADQRVLDRGVAPARYARNLLDRFEGAHPPVAATPGGRPSQLGARIRAALAGSEGPRRGALVLVLLPVLLGLGFFSPLPEAPAPTCNPTLPESP
ncbi:MAG: M56 family metallopeptidase [Proteobacteria bacterium]|nr:M56 family metallopeptidase [Pseudomonadota bacterium]MCP4918122.1 M56 family metallopeptidase [Pseudomonadota bacterium]